MDTSYLAAVVQMNSQTDKRANLAAAERSIAAAAERGARLVVLPELFNCLGPGAVIHDQAETIPGPSSEQLAAAAARHGVILVAGSLAERQSDGDKAYNTCLLFADDGRLLARYRKMHLFDVDIPGQVTYRESDWLAPGDEVVVCDTPLGRIGLAICYDLRFPGLFEHLAAAGADLICVPAAFTLATGRDHWELLVRARAVECQAPVLAANQYGHHGDTLVTYGHSMIVDAWGTVLGRASDGVGVVVAEIDPARTAAIRARLPALAHRRPFPTPPGW